MQCCSVHLGPVGRDGPGLDVLCFVSSQMLAVVSAAGDCSCGFKAHILLRMLASHITSSGKNYRQEPCTLQTFCCKFCVVQYSTLCGMATSPVVVSGTRETCCAVFIRPSTPTLSHCCRTGTDRIPQVRSRDFPGLSS